MPEIDDVLAAEASRWQQQVDAHLDATRVEIGPIRHCRRRSNWTAAPAPRAAGISADSLHQPLRHGRRHRRPWPVVVSAAAVTVLLISIIAVSFTHSNATKHPAAGSSVISITGWHWRLTAVKNNDGAVDIPVDLDASIEFYRTGEFLADDSVNAYSGPYRLTDSGYQTADVAGTAAGYVGHDAAVLATIKGIQAITPYRGSVDRQLSGGRLILSAHGYSLTFVNAGVATPAPPGSPSSPQSTHR